MLVTGLIMLAAATLAGESAAQPTAQDARTPIRWSVTPAHRNGRVQLEIDYRTPDRRHQTSSTVNLDQLRDLNAATLAGTGPAGFRLVRQAGTLDCSGTAGGGSAAGTCALLADEDYTRALVQRGLSRPTELEQLQLIMHPVGIDAVDELQRQGYALPTIEELIAMGVHRADGAYLRELDAAGYRAGTVERLLAMRIHGVSGDYVAGLIAASPRLRGMEADTLLAMRIHGVTPRFVREMAQAGYGEATADDLVSFRIHGVTPEFARQANAVAMQD